MKALIFSFVALSVACVVQACDDYQQQQVYQRQAVKVRRQVVYKQQAVKAYAYNYAAPIKLQQVYPAYYYSVGAAIQEAAIQERVAAGVRDELSQEIRALRQTILQLNQQKMGQPTPAESAIGLQVLQQNCFNCHKPGSKAVTEEDAPVFFDEEGNLTANFEQRVSMLTSAKLGAMPPPPKKELDDESFLAVKVYLDSLRGGDRASSGTVPSQPPGEQP